MKRKKDEPPAFILLYVDDGVIIGTEKIIGETMTKLSQMVKVKDLGIMKHFVGCHIRQTQDKKTIYIHQPKLIKHLQQEFENEVHTTRILSTPEAARMVIMRPEPDDLVLTPAQQTKYRSGVGMLLYLVKHSRPDIANAVRELTKVLDKATPAHWKAMIRVF